MTGFSTMSNRISTRRNGRSCIMYVFAVSPWLFVFSGAFATNGKVLPRFEKRHELKTAREGSQNPPFKDSSLDSKKEGEDESKSSDPLSLASWYAVEAYGKLFGDKNKFKKKNEAASTVNLDESPTSLLEASKRVKLDNDRSYFLSGQVDVLAYDEDCIFSDPFVAFSGRQRFVDNLQNLNSFITEYDARMLDYSQDDEGTTLKTKLMVKLRLNLPWNPVLAWPWGVEYTVDPDTFLITKHKESWDVEPLDGVKQIFRSGKGIQIKKKYALDE